MKTTGSPSLASLFPAFGRELTYQVGVFGRKSKASLPQCYSTLPDLLFIDGGAGVVIWPIEAIAINWYTHHQAHLVQVNLRLLPPGVNPTWSLLGPVSVLVLSTGGKKLPFTTLPPNLIS
jgi:hypothetical protein